MVVLDDDDESDDSGGNNANVGVVTHGNYNEH